MYEPPHILSVSVCYVAVRTTVLPRHGCYRTTLWIFWGSRRMETAPSSIEALLRPTLAQSNEPSDLHYIAARMS